MALFRRRVAAPGPVPSASAEASAVVGAPASADQLAEPPGIDELTPAELRWVDGLRRAMAARGSAASPGEVAALYESVRNGWWRTEPRDRPDANPLVNGLGVALGDVLAAEAGLRWVLATDSAGAELAVTDGDLLVHPVNVIAKRWGDEHSGDFIVGFAAMVAEHIRSRD